MPSHLGWIELFRAFLALLPPIVPTPLEVGHYPHTGKAEIEFAGTGSLSFAAFLRK